MRTKFIKIYDEEKNLLEEEIRKCDAERKYGINSNKIWKFINTGICVKPVKTKDVYYYIFSADAEPEFNGRFVRKPRKSKEHICVKIDRLPDEEFRYIPGYDRYMISNLTRFIHIMKNGDEKLINPDITKNKTGKQYCQHNLNKKAYRRSRIMWRTFIDPSFPLEFHGPWYCTKNNIDPKTDKYYNIIIDHDNDTLDDTIKNLDAISQSDNIRKANGVTGKPAVKCYAFKDGKFKSFRSTMDCVRYCLIGYDEKPNAGRFSVAIKQNGQIRDYFIGYTKEQAKAFYDRANFVKPSTKSTPSTRTRVGKYKYRCIETGEVYDTIGEANKETGISTTAIKHASYNFKGQKTAGGYHWERFI